MIMLNRIHQALLRRLETLTGHIDRTQSAPLVDDDALDSLRATGTAMLAAGSWLEAEACFRQLLVLSANDTKSLVCLAYVLKEQARFSEARIYLRRAIVTGDGAVDAYEWHYLLGEINELEDELEQAALSYAESLRLRPDFSRACRELCRVYERVGRKYVVKSVLLKCVAQSPDCLDYRLWLASLYEGELDFQGVVDQLSAAVGLGTQPVDTWTTLGAAYFRIHHPSDALSTFAVAEVMDSTVGWMRHYHFGYFHIRNGDMADAITELSQAIALNPLCLDAHSLLIMVLSSAGDEGRLAYRAAAMRYARVLATKHTKRFAKSAARTNEGPLRVGFLSSDFRMHPVYHFLRDLLPHFDRRQFQLIAFSNNPINDDATQHLQQLFDKWHDVAGSNDDVVVDLIQADGIDVLIDLGGHTSNCRLSIFAKKPATLQVSWLGYFASTGLPEMDFILADDVSVPQDSQEWFSERVFRLPHTRLCMSVPRTKQPIVVGELPYLKRGYITFGCFQQAAKITLKVLGIWKQILGAVPDAHLRIQGEGFGKSVGQNRVVLAMKSLNFDMSRIELLAPDDFEGYLSAHNDIDILLDTFPYPGGTTTAFALWMAVPTITLTGDTMLARQGEMMMRCVGLDDWIANNELKYIDIAIKKGNSVAELAALRQELRKRAIESPLFASEQFVIGMQQAIVSMHAEVLSCQQAH